MISYFPTPYPDELWYSVLCRYHIRSGNRESMLTFKELLKEKKHGKISSFLPTSDIMEISMQLPEGVIDPYDIAINHTLFKYIFRFQTLEEKKILLARAMKDKCSFPLHFAKSFQEKPIRSCPLCMKEDIETFGEPYWHTAHQIPYALVCYKHGCKLNNVSTSKPHFFNYNLITPDIRNISEPDYEVKRTEVRFVEMMTKYLFLPFQYGPTEGYNNIYEALIDVGYGSVRKDHYFSIDYKRLGADLCEYFGKNLVENVFGTIDFRAMMMGQIYHWIYKMPERYALIATFLNQEPEITFGQWEENRISREFKKLSKSGIKMKKGYAAKKIGISENNLSILSHNLQIKPFWEQREKTDNPKRYRRNMEFTKEEWDYLEEKVNKYGYHSISEYMRYCLHKAMDMERDK